MSDRVRAILITRDNRLLTIKRINPGEEQFSCLPCLPMCRSVPSSGDQRV
jgi:hypothetical protein